MFSRFIGFCLVLLGTLSVSHAGDGNSALIRQVGDNHKVNVVQSSNGSDVTVLQGGDVPFLTSGALGLLEGVWDVGGALGASKNTLDTFDNVAALAIRGTFLLPSAQAVNNEATVIVSGDNSTGNLFQTGDGNTGIVEVTGNNAKGTLWQLGDDNEAGLTVQGNGTKVLYTQKGNGLKTSNLGATTPSEGSVSGNNLTVYAPGNTVTVYQR